MSALNYATEPEVWVEAAQLEAAGLSESLRRELLAFRRRPNQDGAVLLRGLPIGDVPPTPELADNLSAPNLVAASVLSVLTAPLGDQVAFKPELRGQLIQSILPQRDAEGAQRSIGSRVYLEDHIEMAFTEYRADYVVLTCLRGDHSGVAGTAITPVDDVLPLLDDECTAMLRRAEFKTTVDESFLVGWGIDRELWIGPIAVLAGDRGRPTLRVDFAETTGVSKASSKALDQLKKAVSAVRRTIVLEPGDMVIIDNQLAMHGRTPYTPKYDGADRWLLRTFVTRDLSRSRHVRPNDERVIAPDYAQMCGE